MNSVSLLITGSELLDGRVQDTNFRYIAEELTARGISLKRVLFVDDDLNELVKGLHQLSEASSFIIVSGGLGPTSDDLTREAISEFSGLELVEHPGAKKQLEDFYIKRGRILDAFNLKQTLIPASGTLVTNPVGTAPGFFVTTENQITILALPGVPKELVSMCKETVFPLIEERFNEGKKINSVGFKTFGLPESEVGGRVNSAGLSDKVKVSYRAVFPEVHVKLSGFLSLTELAALREKAISALGKEYIFTEDLKETFPEVIFKKLKANNIKISFAESCTGGMVSELLTSVSGSSEVFLGAVVAYSNDVKIKELNVKPETLKTHGAVSEETAREMAFGVREKLGTSIGLSVTGIAGPDGGTEEKPVGTFFVGYADTQSNYAKKFFYSSDRERIRKYASYAALSLL